MMITFDIIVSLLWARCIYYTIDKCFIARYKTPVFSTIFAVYIFSFSCYFRIYYYIYKLLLFFVFVLSLFWFTKHFFYCSATNAIMVNSFIIIALHMVYQISTLLFSFLKGHIPIYLASLICLLLFSMLINYIIRIIISTKTDYKLSIKRTILYLSILSVVYMLEAHITKQDDTMYSCLIVILLLMLIIFSYIVTVRLENEINKNVVLEKQYILTKKYCEDIEKNYDTYKKTAHDINKHLNILTNLSTISNNIKEDYISTINNSVSNFFTDFHCSNLVMNIIMNDKLKEARNNEIKVLMSIEDINFDFLSEYDITSIFYNLWDNALEASKYVDIGHREIRIAIKKNNGLIAVRFENYFDGNLFLDNNNIVTRKKNHEGCGLEIIKTTVHKNKGMYNCKFDNNRFITDIILPLP